MSGCPLNHRQQTGPIGCGYHAAYAITGNERLLEHVTDANPYRYLLRLADAGYLEYALFTLHHPDARAITASRDWWENILAPQVDQAAGYLPLILELGMNVRHRVAIYLPADPQAAVWVSDSIHQEPHAFPDRAAFLDSWYARPAKVFQLVVRDYDLYPHDDALAAFRREAAKGAA